MADLVRNLIQYQGISDYMPDNSTIFKQFTLQDNFCLPDAKPDIEQIVKAICELEITSTKVIKTPAGTSLEGQILTGRKLVVEGKVKIKTEYVANLPEQSVHGAHIIIPFSTFLILPANFIPGTPLKVRGYLEDVYTQMMDERCIFCNIAILLNADYC